MKRFFASSARHISISTAIAKRLGTPSTVIPNPYDHELFQESTDHLREQELVFVGRLVSDKGVNCALAALHLLKQRGVTPALTIIGCGPEEAALRKLACELAIADQVCFAGVKRGRDLAEDLRRHKILVIPSLWEEPFGIVALEGIASGCVAVGSSGGGLKDAIGPCGITFPNGNASALADCLGDLLSNDKRLKAYRQEAKAHLAGFTKLLIAQKYLDVIQLALNSSLAPTPAKAFYGKRC